MPTTPSDHHPFISTRLYHKESSTKINKVFVSDRTFKVKSGWSENAWSKKIAEIKMTVLPPWWRSDWDCIAYIGLILIALVTFCKIHTRAVRLRAVELENELKQRTTDVIQQKKLIEKLTKEAHQQIDYLQQLLKQQQDNPLLRSQTHFTKGKRTCLLIIDDTQDMLLYLGKLLQPGFDCLLAKSGEQGLCLVKNQLPDLVICNVMMFDMSGFDVLDSLREDLFTSHIPVLMLTDKNDKQSRLLSFRKLADDYITKPFDNDELIARIHSILSLQKLRQNQLLNQLLDKETAKPGRKLTVELTPRDKAFIEKWNATVEKHYSDPNTNVEKLAGYMCISPGHLLDKLKALTGKGPKEFLIEYRIAAAKRILTTQTLSIAEVAEAVGYNNQPHFSTTFKKLTKVTPSEYRRRPPEVE